MNTRNRTAMKVLVLAVIFAVVVIGALILTSLARNQSDIIVAAEHGLCDNPSTNPIYNRMMTAADTASDCRKMVESYDKSVNRLSQNRAKVSFHYATPEDATDTVIVERDAKGEWHPVK